MFAQKSGGQPGRVSVRVRTGPACVIYTLCYIFEGESSQYDHVSETCDDVESGDESNDNSIMPPLISKEEIDAIDSGGESEDEHMSTEILEDIYDSIKYHPSVNRRESRYKICYCIKRRQRNGKACTMLKDGACKLMM